MKLSESILLVLALAITPSSATEPAPQAVSGAPPSDAAQFCANVKDEARERRYALKEQEIGALMVQVDERIKALEKKRAEFEEWQNRREQFAKLATEGLVDIYAKMRPAAAAERLGKLSTELSASILMKLSSRQSGVILNEMDVEIAATITNVIAASSQRKDPS